VLLASVSIVKVLALKSCTGCRTEKNTGRHDTNIKLWLEQHSPFGIQPANQVVLSETAVLCTCNGMQVSIGAMGLTAAQPVAVDCDSAAAHKAGFQCGWPHLVL